MGYYSNFEVVDTDIEDILDVLRANTGVYGDSWYGALPYLDSMKWYDWDKDLQQIAYQYPDNYLIILRTGEESPDMERAIVRNGKVKLQRPNITWPPE
jgi:hypothetical protein